MLRQHRGTVVAVIGLCFGAHSASVAQQKDDRQRAAEQQTLWRNVKWALTGPNADQYFEENVKNALLPPLRGSAISVDLRDGETKLVLGMTYPETPEVTLVLHHADAEVKTAPQQGSVIEFSGVGSAFIKEPFMLTFLVKPDRIAGINFSRKR